jgi:hypothetical protein
MKRQLYISILSLLLLSVHGQKKEDSLFVFIGEKISVKPFKPDVPAGTMLMDNFYIAKYVVLDRIFGEFKKDTIEFEVADHGDEYPKFATYKNVILYVERDGGQWYHVKYMYTALYKTVDNKWAGMYQGRDYAHINNKNTTIKPVKIQFKDKPCIDTTETKWYTFGDSYDPLYYKVEGKKAYPTHGNYIPELFLLKKNGFMKYSGYFKEP